MTAETERQSATEDTGSVDALGRCPRCSMRVRRDEMDIHLAHAHNIGPVVTKEKGKDRRNKRRPPRDE